MTNAEARFNKSLRPRKPEGSVGRTAQDGHLDFHTALHSGAGHDGGTTNVFASASPAGETAFAQCTSRWAMARGHRLNTSIVLAAVHGLSGLFRTVSAVEPLLCCPLPTLSPSLTGHLASVDVK